MPSSFIVSDAALPFPRSNVSSWSLPDCDWALPQLPTPPSQISLVKLIVKLIILLCNRLQEFVSPFSTLRSVIPRSFERRNGTLVLPLISRPRDVKVIIAP